MTPSTRWIPKDATAVEQAGGIVYKYERNARPCAVAYAGKASKPAWNYSFIGRDVEAQREKRIQEFFAGLAARAAMMAEFKAERSKPHNFTVGDIVVNSWGYDQTNIDFYVVTQTTAHYVWVQPIASQTKETGFMCGDTVPELPPRPCKRCGSGPIDPPEKHKAQPGRVNFEYGSGYKWDGRTERSSWYA